MIDFKCAVCENLVAEDDFGTCTVCDWIHDPVQEEDPDYFGGANWLTLNQARATWSKYGVGITEQQKKERADYYAEKRASQKISA